MSTMIVQIEGEPFLSRAREYRAAYEAVLERWRAFAKERGASGISGSLSGLIFAGRAPEGWTKPVRNGFSRPKDKHPDAELMKALGKLPSSYEVFGDTVIHDLRYEGPGGSYGSGGIGYMFNGPSIGWTGDIFVAVIPDAASAAAAHLAHRPDDRITNGADTWRLPSGLVKITEAERDLIFAQAAVERERAAAASGMEAA